MMESDDVYNRCNLVFEECVRRCLSDKPITPDEILEYCQKNVDKVTFDLMPHYEFGLVEIICHPAFNRLSLLLLIRQGKVEFVGGKCRKPLPRDIDSDWRV